MNYRAVLDEVGGYINLYQDKNLLATLNFNQTNEQWGTFGVSGTRMAYCLKKEYGAWKLTVYQCLSDSSVRYNTAISVPMKNIEDLMIVS